MDQPSPEHPRNPDPAKPRYSFARHVSSTADTLRDTRKAWPGLSLYERFEEVVVVVLTALIGLVIIAAVINLCFRVVALVIFGLLDPAEHSVFQAVFGMIFTVLIALEFNHSILTVTRSRSAMASDGPFRRPWRAGRSWPTRATC